MKKSYITILLLLMVMILGISAVSAADIDKSNDLTAISDESALEVDDSIEEIQSTDDSEILAESGNNFTTLQDEINEDGKTSLTLTKDYVRDFGESDIEINKDFTIDGANTYKINAIDVGGIFKVNNGCTLTLIGVTLINGNAVDGAAIYNDGGTVNATSCKFLDNTATQSGGAIYNNGGNLNLDTCTFDGNDLADRRTNGWGGAAIYDNAGTVTMENCKVTNNLKNIEHRGGTGAYVGDLCSAAVSSTGTLTVSGSTFENNSGCYGGAILSNGANAVLTVSGSTFTNNFAFNGGAIDFAGNTYTITGSTFKGNKARGTGSSNSNYAHGGAIATQETNGDCIISNCKFEDNSAVMGGAISSTNNQIVGCNFTNNTAKAAYSENFNGKENNRGGYGSAIYNDASMTIADSTFTDNPNDRGNGAVYAKDAEITGSSFTNSLIYDNRGPLTVSNNQYDNEGNDIVGGNSPKIYFDGVGDVPNVKSASLYYGASSFADLKALIDSGSTATVFLTDDITKLDSEEEIFADGILIDRSITIDADGHTITANNGKVFTVTADGSLTLRNANVVGDGTSAIVNNGKVTVSLSYPTTFENVGKYAIDNKGRVTETSLTTFTQLNDLICLVNGGEVYIGSSKITKTDDEKETFKDGIVIENDVTIKGTTTSKGVINTVIDAANDGRIFSVNDGADVTLDTLILKNGNAENGGAVYVEANNKLVANNVKFIDNVASEYNGGAIYTVGGTISLTDCVLDGNDVSKFETAASQNMGGSAIYAKDATVALINTDVINNGRDLNRTKGDLANGVLNLLNSDTTITRCLFENNTGIYGGAVYAEGGKIIISDSQFTANKAYCGAAIQLEGGIDFNIQDTTFINNKVEGSGSTGYSSGGGAIFVRTADGTMNNITVKGSSAVNGGAISLENSKTTLTDSTFENNVADKWGGAIESNGDSELSISGSTFKENTAAAATIVTFGNSGASISDCNFTDNTDTYGWGVVTVYGTGDVTIENSNFNKQFSDNTVDVYVVEDSNVEIKDSTFNTTVNYAIVAKNGKINMENNEIQAALDYPIFTYGAAEIVSNINAIISEGKTYNKHLGEVVIDTILTDDNGIFIRDANVKYIIFKDGVEYATVDTTFYGDPLYRAIYAFTEPGTYVVTLNHDGEVANATYIVSASLTDLKNKIDAANAGDTVSLGFDYAYIAEFDEGLEKGIVIDKDLTIDGNGYTINGNNAARIFNITAETTIKDTKIVNATSSDFAAIYSEADLTVEDCYFNNNAARYGGAIAQVGNTLTVIDSEFEKNQALYGGAIYVNEATAIIEGSNFTENVATGVGSGGRVPSGGAIMVFPETGKLQVKDSVFTKNTATTGSGGAISISETTTDSSIKGCTFVENTAQVGGAVNYQPTGTQGTLSVDGSSFTNNGADYYGGAICEMGGNAVITDSNFTSNNAAKNGGAIYARGGSADVEDSKFESNTANGDANSIYAYGERLELSGNTIAGNNAEIVVVKNSQIISEVNIIVLDNKTWNDTGLGDIYTLKATLTDDMGNNIRDSSFRFTVDGVVIDDTPLYDEATGLYTVGYAIETAGLKVISASYSATNLEIFTGALDIAKANVTEFIVSTGQNNNFPHGENVTVFVSLRGIDNVGLNETFNVIINNTEYTVTVTDGEGSFNVSGLDSDTYSILALFDSNPNYNKAYAQGIFYVTDKTVLTIDEIGEVEYGEPIEVTIHLTDSEGNNLNGVVIVNENEVLVQDGVGVFTIDTQPDVGEYNISAFYNANNFYYESESNVTYKVIAKKLTEDDISVLFDVDDPDKVTVFIDGPDAVYNVTVDGQTVQVTVADGDGYAEISGLTFGDKTATIAIVDDNYDLDPFTEDFRYIIDSEFEADIINESIKYEENATVKITISPDATGNITVYDNDELWYEFTVDEARGGIDIPLLTVGEHEIKFVYSGDDKYEKATFYDWVNVEKTTPAIEVNVTADPKVGDKVTLNVSVSVNEDGNLTIIVDGKEIFKGETDLGGLASADVDFDLDDGEHTYIVTFEGTDNYLSNQTIGTFTVVKSSPTISIVVENMNNLVAIASSTLTITVADGDATGFILIEGLDSIIYEELENGAYTLDPFVLPADEYNITVTYFGNEKYLKASNSLVFTVPKGSATPEVVVLTPEIKGGEQAELNITMDSNSATGLVRIYVDGVESGFAVLDADYANATVVINELTNGTHTIGIKYAGNDNFNESDIINVTVTVVKADSKVTIDPITNVTVGNDVVIYYKIENNTNNIKIEFTNPNDEITVDYELFEDRIVVHNLAAGDYEVKVYNMENEFYNTDAAVALFTVNKIDVSDKISIDPETITYGENATVIVSGFPEAATGNVTIKIGNKNYTAKVEQGQAIIEISGLAAGNYTDLAVEYTGDDVYNATNAMCAIYVNKAKSEVSISVIDDMPYPGEFTIAYTIENETKVVITVNGPKGEVIPHTVVDGKVVLTNLAAGEYYITIENKENENFTGSEADYRFNVYKATPTFTSNVTEGAKVGENVTITVKAPLDATGNVSVSVDGEIVAANLPVINGVATINITGLAAGHHSYEVTYNGDDNYEIASDLQSFDVAKVETPVEDVLNITIPESTTSPEVTIDLPEDATGYLLVDVDGDQYYEPLVDGSTSIQTLPLSGGNHTVTVTYTGDEKYAGFTKTETVNIPSNVTADNALDVPTSSETGSPTFSVNLPSDATGFLIVDVDGKKYAAVVENGTASVTVPGLSEGNHNVTVVYSGDDKYPTLSKDTTVNVHIPVYKITNNKNVGPRYSAVAYYTVLVTKDGKAVGAGESVTIKYNGKTYTVKTDANGNAKFKLITKVKVKKYAITATYKGVTVKNTITVKNIIKAKNKKVKKSKKVTKVKVSLIKVNGKYLKAKKIKIKFRGKTYKVKTNKKGVATWKVKKSMLKKLKVGKKYKYRVTYGKDVVTKKLTIKR